MNTSMETVTAFEAKTHLSEILRKVQSGDSVIVTLRGKPIAKILPFSEKSSTSAESAVEKLRTIRKTVKGKINIRKMIEEGRTR
jgi:prevent-host-death family protein